MSGVLKNIALLIGELSVENLDRVQSLLFKATTGEDQRLCAYAMLCWGELGVARLTEAAIVEQSPSKLANIIRLLAAGASGDLSVGALFSGHSFPLLRKMNMAINDNVIGERVKRSLDRIFTEGDAQDLLGALGICFSQFDQSEHEMVSELIDAARCRWKRGG